VGFQRRWRFRWPGATYFAQVQKRNIEARAEGYEDKLKRKRRESKISAMRIEMV
jgi:hypothetical protein